MQLKDLLIQKFFEWQQTEGEIKSQVEFARFLDVRQPTLSSWISGDRIPTGENVDKLAEKLGPEIYDALGLERPDPRLVYIQRVWELLPSEARLELADLAQQLHEENPNEGGKNDAIMQIADKLELPK